MRQFYTVQFFFDTNIKFAPLDILLGIPNPEKDSVISTINVLGLFGKSVIKKYGEESLMVYFYEFQVKLKKQSVYWKGNFIE